MQRLLRNKNLLPNPSTRTGTAASSPAFSNSTLQSLTRAKQRAEAAWSRYEEVKQDHAFNTREKEAYAIAKAKPAHQRDLDEVQETDMGLQRLTKSGPLPRGVKNFIEECSEHVEQSQLLLCLFWDWYKAQFKSCVKQIEDLPVLLKQQIEQKVVNYWKEQRRQRSVKEEVLDSLEDVALPKDMKPNLWRTFVKRFKKCFEEDPSSKKTFKTISALYLTKYDSKMDWELYAHCKTLLSKASRVWVCRENQRKRDKKATEKQNQFSQKNQTCSYVCDDNDDSLELYKPDRMFSHHRGRKEDYHILRKKPTGTNPRLFKVEERFPLVQETYNFKKWEDSMLMTQAEHDYDSDVLQVELGKTLLTKDLQESIDAYASQFTVHVSEEAQIRMLHSVFAPNRLDQDAIVLRQEDITEGYLRSTIGNGKIGQVPPAKSSRKR